MGTADRCGDHTNLRAGPCRLRPGHVCDHEWESSSGWRRTWPQTYNGPSPLDDPPTEGEKTHG